MRINILSLLTYCIIILACYADDGWVLTKQTDDSFQPPPRSFPGVFPIDESHAILFSGYFERVDYSNGKNSVFNNDVFILDASNPDLIKWTKVELAEGSIEPAPRSIPCAVYSPLDDAIYMYGGTTYDADFTNFIFYDDAWVFDLSTRSWTLLYEHAPAGTRAGAGCDYLDGKIYISHGSRGLDLFFYDDTWIWDLVTNTWTLLATSEIRPRGRFQLGFNRIPGTENFLLLNGQWTPGQRRQIYLQDVWVLNSNTLNWQELDVSNSPQPVHDSTAYALTSSKWLLMSGGDSNENQTVEDTCPYPLDCAVPVNPTDTNYFLSLKINQGIAQWQDEADFEHNIPPLRKPAMVILEPYIYLVGGMDWDGIHLVGEIYNQYTWRLKLKNKYFN
jgi:hypothetical protein